MAHGDTLVNAIIGAAVTAVLSPILPFSALFGGAIAGYLQGGTRSDGLRIGAISGGIAFVPVVLIVGLIFLLVLPVFLGIGASEALGVGLFSGVIAIGFLGVVAVYIIGLSVLGGWLGNYVETDTDVDF